LHFFEGLTLQAIRFCELAAHKVPFLNEGLFGIELCFCGRGTKGTGNGRKVMKMLDFSAFIFTVRGVAILSGPPAC
jgi:hypothetical protein